MPSGPGSSPVVRGGLGFVDDGVVVLAVEMLVWVGEVRESADGGAVEVLLLVVAVVPAEGSYVPASDGEYSHVGNSCYMGLC